MLTSNIVYVSGLKAGARPLEVCRNLCLSAIPAEVTSDVILHGDTAFFLVFANAQQAEATIQHFTGKPVFDGYGMVDGLNSKSHKILMQLKPEIFGAVGKATASTGSEVPTSDIESLAKLSDVLEAIAGWSLEQKQQLGAALGFSTSGAVVEPTSSVQGPQVPVGPAAPKMGVPYTPMFNPPQMGCFSQHPVPPQPVFSTPHPEQSFQFGSSNTVNNIRVSTFSGS